MIEKNRVKKYNLTTHGQGSVNHNWNKGLAEGGVANPLQNGLKGHKQYVDGRYKAKDKYYELRVMELKQKQEQHQQKMEAKKEQVTDMVKALAVDQEALTELGAFILQRDFAETGMNKRKILKTIQKDASTYQMLWKMSQN
eukprot:971767_1